MTTPKYLLAIIATLTIPAVSLAAPRPQFYPNAHYKKVGATQANADFGVCDGEARGAVGSDTNQESVAGRGVRGAAKGAALGAIGGAVMGKNVGRSVGAGAAIGGTAGTVRGAKARGELSPEYKKYVEACLEEKGYKVVGWR